MPKLLRKLTSLISLLMLVFTAAVTPSNVEAKLCSQTNWQVDVSTPGQPHNVVATNQPFTVTITIPGSEYSSSFTQFRARTMDRIPLQKPGLGDEDPIQSLNGINEEIVPAPPKNPSGPTVVKINFSKSNELYGREGNHLVEIDYFPRSPTNNSWARKCDTNSNPERFSVGLDQTPKCSIDGATACMVEGNGFNLQVNASQSGFDYYYFLVNGNPPPVGSDMGVYTLYTGGGSFIAPALTNGNVKFKTSGYTAEDTWFSSNVVAASDSLSRYKSIFDNFPLDPTKKYSLFVVGARGNPSNPFDTGTTGIPGKVCAALSFVKTADDSAPICKQDLGGGSGGTGGAPVGCVEGEVGQNCTSAAGKSCVFEGSQGIETAIGCVPTNPVALTRTILRFSAGIGGGLALIMMIIGSFQMMLSAGNRDRLQAGQDRFKNALIGLLFILFAVLLMRLIGVDILGLDKFLGVS